MTNSLTSLLKEPTVDTFFPPYFMDPTRWNRLYPYRLMVVEYISGQYVPVNGYPTKAWGKLSLLPKESKGLEYVISTQIDWEGWICTLPITPQQLQIVDQFAINTTATMRGIVEEHNGIKFKIINVSGTTGIWPQKPTIAGAISTPSNLQSIAAGTLESASNLVDSVTSVGSSFSGKHPNAALEAENPADEGLFMSTSIDNDLQYSTGYFQALNMANFFERYAQAKKNPANKGWRLVFDIPKRNQSFLVSPIQFTSGQNHQKPNEFLFSFQLKAWKRITLNSVDPASVELPSLTANEFQKINNTIKSVRQVLSDASNLIKAVRSDFQKVFEIGRQLALTVKDVGGVIVSVAELPKQIIKDFDSMIVDQWKDLGNVFVPPGQAKDTGAFNKNISVFIPSAITPGVSSSAEKSGAVVQAVIAQNKANEGLSRLAIETGALGDDAAYAQKTDPLNNVFEDSEAYFELFDAISLDTLALNETQQEAIDNEIEAVQLLTVDDFRDFKEEYTQLAIDIANSYGASDPVYAEIYGRPEPKTRILPMTIEENEVLVAIMEMVQVLDLLTSTKTWDDLHVTNTLDFVGQLANEAEIDFEQPQGKILVPVPFDLTIEEISARYLGNPHKWIEIATLNYLRSPYIDEDGYIYELLSNAEGRQFNVNDEQGRLYIGQQIVLTSSIVPVFTRIITDVEKIGDNNYLVTVDGLDNLDNLKTVNSAYIQGYLPGTVNSQNQIYIPVNTTPTEDDRTFTIPSLDSSHLVQISKIDWLLTDSGDVAINSVGEWRLASGLTNLIQAIKLMVRTKQNTLLNHLGYGLGLKVGVSVADIENGEIIQSFNRMISKDPRFVSIHRMDLKLNGPTLAIDMVINLANGNGVLPLNFDIRVGN